MSLRNILKHKVFIHSLVLLGFFALYGYVSTQNPMILLGVTASFAGAICGAFILVIDTIKANK